jgi:hypothetical protein
MNPPKPSPGVAVFADCCRGSVLLYSERSEHWLQLVRSLDFGGVYLPLAMMGGLILRELERQMPTLFIDAAVPLENRTTIWGKSAFQPCSTIHQP